MRGKEKKITTIFVFLTILFISMACNLEDYRAPTSKEDPGDQMILTGSVINTWSWGPGSSPCETVDEMKLTISHDNNAVLNVRGVCFSQPVGDEKCRAYESNLPCGLVVYGTYDSDKKKVTFTACNNSQDKNGSGEVLIEEGAELATKTLTGSASCTFSNSSEEHTLNFSSP